MAREPFLIARYLVLGPLGLLHMARSVRTGEGCGWGWTNELLRKGTDWPPARALKLGQHTVFKEGYSTWAPPSISQE
jgi:hypothetical protein